VSDDGATSVAPSLEASSLEIRIGLCQWLVEMRLFCVGGSVLRIHGCWFVLGWRAGCSGELGVGWAEVKLSLRS
jgi:hypothetical protein